MSEDSEDKEGNGEKDDGLSVSLVILIESCPTDIKIFFKN